MPVISQLNLTNQNPVNAYTASVMTSASLLSDGLGNQLTNLNLTSSFANTSSFSFYSVVSTSSFFDISSSFASQSMWTTSASFSSASVTSSYTISASNASSLILFNPTNGKWYSISISGSTGTELLNLTSLS